MYLRLILLLLITATVQNIKSQDLRASDIDTVGKTEVEICKEISSKLDSLNQLYSIPENSTFNKGYIFPEFEESYKEKRKGYLIFKDSKGILPDSIKSCDLYVGFRVDPYGRVLCFKLMRFINNKDVITDRTLLENELELFIMKRVLGPGYAGSKEKGAIYFPFYPRKIRIQK